MIYRWEKFIEKHISKSTLPIIDDTIDSINDILISELEDEGIDYDFVLIIRYIIDSKPNYIFISTDEKIITGSSNRFDILNDYLQSSPSIQSDENSLIDYQSSLRSLIIQLKRHKIEYSIIIGISTNFKSNLSLKKEKFNKLLDELDSRICNEFDFIKFDKSDKDLPSFFSESALVYYLKK
jgi:hypothetical protein